MVEVKTGPSSRGSSRRGRISKVHWDLCKNLCGHFSNLLYYQIHAFIKLATQLNHCSISELASISLRIKQTQSTCCLKKKNPQTPRYVKVTAEEQSFCVRKEFKKARMHIVLLLCHRTSAAYLKLQC